MRGWREAEDAARTSRDEDFSRGRKVKKKSSKLAKGLAITGIIATLLSGAKVEWKEDTPASYTPAGYGYETVSTDYTVLDYTLDGSIGGQVTQDSIINVLQFGDYCINTGGMVINSNSLLSGNNSTVRDGECQITGISVVDRRTNRILASANVNNGNVSDEVRSAPFGDFINNALRDNGLNRQDVAIRFHLGRVRDDYEGIPMRNHGWIDSSQYFDSRCYDEAIWRRALMSLAHLEGTIYGFTGDSIVINGVTIPVKGPNGEFLAPGTKVVGSNGHEYVINSLNATTTHEEEQQYVYHDATYTDAVPGGPSLSYNITDISLWPLILGFAAAKVTNVIKNRKKKNDDEEEEEDTRSGGDDSGRRSEGGGSRRDDSGSTGGRDGSSEPIMPYGRRRDIPVDRGVPGSYDYPTYSAEDLDSIMEEIGGPSRGRRG